MLLFLSGVSACTIVDSYSLH